MIRDSIDSFSIQVKEVTGLDHGIDPTHVARASNLSLSQNSSCFENWLKGCHAILIRYG